MKNTLLLLFSVLILSVFACADDPGPAATPVPDLTLSSLTVSSGTLVPAFDAAVTAYTLAVPNPVDQLTVEAVAAAAETGIAYEPAQTTALAVGSNLIRIHLTDGDGATTNTYRIVVQRAPDCTLAALSLSAGTLVPPFDPATTVYTANVANAVDTITVSATKADDADHLSYDPVQPAPLAVGTNLLRIRLTSADGSMTNTYQVTVLRVATNAALASLAISVGFLVPTFDPAITEYRIAVHLSNSVTTAMFSAATAHPGATISYQSGQPAVLSAGSNQLTVRVTAEDGVTVRNYRIRVYRMAAQLVSAAVGTLLPVPAGTFQRDGTAGNTSYVSACRMGRTEVTRAQYSNLMHYDPSDPTCSSGTGDPVMKLTWFDAVEFCNKLSQQEGLTPVYTITGRMPASGYPVTNATVTVADWNAGGYRLPTEMEWLWAAMGGNMGGDPFAVNTTGRLKNFAGDNGSRTIDQCAWCELKPTTTAAGSLLPNELGFVDLSGNASEWLWDWMAYSGAQDNYAISGHVADHRGAVTGSNRVLRGGSWYRWASECMLSTRGSVPPYDFSVYWGFRVVRR